MNTPLPLNQRSFFYPIKVFFSSLSHDDSSFVGASDVSQFSVQYNTYFGRARLRSDAKRVQGQTTWVRPRQDPGSRELHSCVDAWYTGHSACHSDKDIFTIRQRYCYTPTKIWIDRYSLWKSLPRASFRVVHSKSHKNPFWCSLAIPFSLPSQRQKVVKLFSSKPEHSSRRAPSLGWSEGLQHFLTINVSQLLCCSRGNSTSLNFRPLGNPNE